jgi:hypothetical protein
MHTILWDFSGEDSPHGFFSPPVGDGDGRRIALPLGFQPCAEMGSDRLARSIGEAVSKSDFDGQVHKARFTRGREFVRADPSRGRERRSPALRWAHRAAREPLAAG